MGTRVWVLAGLALALPGLARAVGPCPSDAGISVFAQNLSAAAEVVLSVEGDLVNPAASCSGPGALAYAQTLTCTGAGLVECGHVTGLRPGAWVNRVSLTVDGSAPQVQAERAVFLAGGSNVVVWTVYPRTFVVTEATDADLREQLRLAGGSGGRALVTFARTVFPGAESPQVIALTDRVCEPAGRNCAALRLTASHVVVDALDVHGQPGAVVLSVGTRRHSVLRILGSDNVLRGLVLEGTRTDAPLSQYDTVAISGPAARDNRIERSIIRGPTMGDAIGIDGGAGALAEDGSGATVIEGCELTDAHDRGLKVTTRSHVEIRRSCVHDNRNGGVQGTTGSHVTAIDNVLQHNVAGPAQNGLAVGGTPGDERSVLVSSGNIVRFAGSRGVSVTDNAQATFTHDYVGDAQFAGGRVETTVVGTNPDVRFRGVAFVCNRQAGITGVCRPRRGLDDEVCVTDADCCGHDKGCCATDPDCTTPSVCHLNNSVDGFGAVQAAGCSGCTPPLVDYGDASQDGANAFTLNASLSRGTAGVNVKLSLPGVDPASFVVSALGNQWEHCGRNASCDLSAVQTLDVEATGGSIDFGTPLNPRAGTPVPTSYSPGRPAAGDVVRIFGRGFNAIEGAACAPATAPLEPCSVDNPNVAAMNTCPRTGNCLQLIIGGQTIPLAVAAVTPTMVAFRMPFDCYAPVTVRVARQGIDARSVEGSMSFCDPSGCFDRPETDPCDDGDVCTIADHCRGLVPECVPGTSIACTGVCLSGACDPRTGCVPAPASTTCDDGDPCTFGDHCSGTSDACVPGPDPCAGPCRTGSCGHCTALPETVPCDDHDPCTVADHCGADGACIAGRPLSCDDGDLCTRDACDAAGTCVHTTLHAFDAITCRAAILQAAAAASAGGRKLGRAAGRASDETAEAERAKGQGDLRGALHRLRRARVRLRAALGLLRGPLDLSAPERRTLRDVAHAALAELETQRTTIVEALGATRSHRRSL